MANKWWNKLTMDSLVQRAKAAVNIKGKSRKKSSRRKRMPAFLRKYVPSLLLMFSSFNANANPTNSATQNNFVQKHKTEIRGKAQQAVAKMKNPHAEALSMVYMSNNMFDALYSPKGKATIENATGIGPLLTRTDDLAAFIRANKKAYTDLYNILEKDGINSSDFFKVWCSYDKPGKREKIINDLVKFSWNKDFQPTFDALAKAGYRHITFDTKDNGENWGLAAAVISCLGQSKRQTLDIFSTARKQAVKKLGENASEQEIMDMATDLSYDERHRRWSDTYNMDLRYYGIEKTASGEIKKTMTGEKELNKSIREKLRAGAELPTSELMTKNADVVEKSTENTQTAADNKQEVGQRQRSRIHVLFTPEEQEYMRRIINTILVVNRDALDANEEDSLYWRGISEFGDGILRKSVVQEQIDELVKKAEKLEDEVFKMNEELENLAMSEYTVLGVKVRIDNRTVKPETIAHVYESANDPTKIALDGKAKGSYQMNYKNTFPAFIKWFAKTNPNLQEAQDLLTALKDHGTKSAEVNAIWDRLATGPLADFFQEKQFVYMWKEYKGTVNSLYKEFGFNGEITPENRADDDKIVFVGSAMSIFNQGYIDRTKQFMRAAYEECTKGKPASYKPTPNEIGLAAYGKRWKAYKNRNIQEKKLCENILACRELMAEINEKEQELQKVDMALNNLGYARPTYKNYLAQNESSREKLETSRAVYHHSRAVRIKMTLRKKFAEGEETKTSIAQNNRSKQSEAERQV